jgi:hypothetical protein
MDEFISWRGLQTNWHIHIKIPVKTDLLKTNLHTHDLSINNNAPKTCTIQHRTLQSFTAEPHTAVWPHGITAELTGTPEQRSFLRRHRSLKVLQKHYHVYETGNLIPVFTPAMPLQSQMSPVHTSSMYTLILSSHLCQVFKVFSSVQVFLLRFGIHLSHLTCVLHDLPNFGCYNAISNPIENKFTQVQKTFVSLK